MADPDAADAVMVNTCGFVEAAKKDSVDTLLAAADLKATGRAQAVVAVGCLAERYGTELAEAMPEADAVLGFDDYADMAGRLQAILAGERPTAHVPRDRRRLLPLAPADRPAAAGRVTIPGHGRPAADRGRVRRAAPAERRSDRAAEDRLRLRPALHASAPSRRSAALTSPGRRPRSWPRPAGWPSTGSGSCSWSARTPPRYGKDLGDIRLLEQLLTELSAVDGLDWIRVSYLQPAEMRPEPGRGDDRHRQGGAVLRPVLPARRAGRAAADAPVR